MYIGIFGSSDDLQTQHLKQALEARQAQVLLVDAYAPLQGLPVQFDGEQFWYQGQPTSEVGCWFMRHILMSVPDAFSHQENYHLFKDWHSSFVRRREWVGFQMSWLLNEAVCRGVPVVNPPVHGGILQHKPYQIARARQVGLTVPATLVTNDPEAARAFAASYAHVVYKPTMGGGLCQVLKPEDHRYLEQIRVSPVTFQEAALGICLRVTLLAEEIMSVVAIPTETVDYRQDPDYLAGQVRYVPQILPETIALQLKTLMRALNLTFAGIDLILKPNGEYVFIEANPSPIYLEIERQTGHAITEKIAEQLLAYVAAPPDIAYQLGTDPCLPGLVKYTNPFDPAGLPWQEA